MRNDRVSEWIDSLKLTVAAAENLIEHEELMHVEEDSGRVADEEDEHDAEQNRGQIHLRTRMIILVMLLLLQRMLLLLADHRLGPLSIPLNSSLPQSQENVEIEDGQDKDRPQAGGEQSGPIDVQPDIIRVNAQIGRSENHFFLNEDILFLLFSLAF